MRKIAPIALVLVLAACGGVSGDDGDIAYLDVPWSFGSEDTDAGTLPPTDSSLGLDTVAPEDTWPPDDTPTPEDIVDPEDIPEPEDTPAPEDTPLPLDINTDTGPCGGCPTDYPNCVNGVCKCTPFSCTDGTYCKGGLCVPCTVDAHCGPDCLSCGSKGQFCSVDGTTCLDCDDAHPCPQSQSCIDNVCTPCEVLGFCGPDCVTCPAETPICSGGACVCNVSSCPAEHVCEGGDCVPCTLSDPNHCGAECLVCGGDTPHCQWGTCVLCDIPQACGPTCQPCGGALAYCPPDGSGCVECFQDAHCGVFEHCAGNTCVPDCTAQACASDLGPSGHECSSAKIIGRTAADVNAGAFLTSGDTTDDGDDDDLPSWGVDCWDAQDDNFFRLWLNAGDQVILVADPVESDYQLSLKAYYGTGCDDEDNLIECSWDEDDGDPESIIHTAAVDDWITIVVDGASGFNDQHDWGHYDLAVTLMCADPGCCCP